MFIGIHGRLLLGLLLLGRRRSVLRDGLQRRHHEAGAGREAASLHRQQRGVGGGVRTTW
jgi:hypothetical protein